MSIRHSARTAGVGRILAVGRSGRSGAPASSAPSSSRRRRVRADQPAPSEETPLASTLMNCVASCVSGLAQAAVRLPLAALFGAALALRPRRASSPPRDPAVIETQIVLAIVGALIMLIVGASLARAFGIAGAANLIRYRAKIEDPKDAVVMLSTLALGLASGVGLFGIATGCHDLPGGHAVDHRRVRDAGAHVPAHRQARRQDVGAPRGGGATVQEGRNESSSCGRRRRRRVVVSRERRRVAEDRTLSAALSALAPDGKAQIEWKDEKNARPLAERTRNEPDHSARSRPGAGRARDSAGQANASTSPSSGPTAKKSRRRSARRRSARRPGARARRPHQPRWREPACASSSSGCSRRGRRSRARATISFAITGSSWWPTTRCTCSASTSPKVDTIKSRSFGVSTKDESAVREAQALFDADSSRQPFVPKRTHLVVSPENARETLTAFIKGAKRQLLIYDVNIQDPRRSSSCWSSRRRRASTCA